MGTVTLSNWIGKFGLLPVVLGLFQQGMITNKIASLVFTPNFNNEQSFVSFGGTPTNATTGPSFTHQAYEYGCEWFLSNVENFEFGGNSYYNAGD